MPLMYMAGSALRTVLDRWWIKLVSSCKFTSMQARMGINMEVLDPTPDCPASRVARHTLGSFKEPESIR